MMNAIISSTFTYAIHHKANAQNITGYLRFLLLYKLTFLNSFFFLWGLIYNCFDTYYIPGITFKHNIQVW